MKGDGDVTRLPKWAQERIWMLEQTLLRQREKIAELTGMHPDSNVRISGYHSYPDTTLPPDSQVVFYLGESRERHRDTISVNHRMGGHSLEVRASDMRLVIHPVSGNAANLKIERF